MRSLTPVCPRSYPCVKPNIIPAEAQDTKGCIECTAVRTYLILISESKHKIIQFGRVPLVDLCPDVNPT